jgi:hypothetical protein
VERRLSMRTLNAVVLMTIVAVGGPAFAEDAMPSGTIMIDQTQVEVILGGDIGKGHLTTGGQNYTFKSGGLKLGGVGIHTEHLIGQVYNMNQASDLEGTYFEAEAGITVAKGVGGVWMKSDKGVSIHLRSADDTGVALSIGVEGFRIHDLQPDE